MVALNVRPIMTIYPSRACHSPYYVGNDVRPEPDKFDEYMKNDKDEV